MRHRKKTVKLNMTPSHRRAVLANVVRSLFNRGHIVTTLARAKEASIVADKLVTLAKQNTLHTRRQAVVTLRDPETVRKLFSDIGQLNMKRQGGYTRVVRLRNRHGDNAPLAILELVERVIKEEKDRKKAKTPKLEKAEKKGKTEKREQAMKKVKTEKK